MTLTRFTVRDFQAHRSFRLDLGPVVVISGRSDAGKSSLLRALRWLCANRPSGEAFLRDGASTVRVSLVVDGHKVTRRKGKGGNTYSLDGEVYKAFGTEVPTPVLELLNIGEVSWSSQHSAPFWFSLTPGQVSQELNQIVDLGLIDLTQANLAKDLRRARAEAEVTEKRLGEAQERLTKLDWVPRATAKMAAVQALAQQLEQIRSKAAVVAQALQAARGVTERLERLGRNDNATKGQLARLEGLRQALGVAQGKAQALQSLYGRIQRAQVEVNLARDRAWDAEWELGKLGKTCPVCGRSEDAG